MVPLHVVPRRCVNLPPGALRVLAGCVLSRTVQTGSELEAFHQAFAHWLGVPYAFGASAGRSAFQLGLEALGLEPGAEIIFPAFTFPVIPLVAKRLGYQPVFCDVDGETFNAGPQHIEPRLTAQTGAIVATHLFGQPCAIEAIVALARQRGIRVMEDCAHACGVRINGRQVGTFGDVGVFSFAEGKNMPCFGGGAIATADDAIAKRAEDILSRASLPTTAAAVQTALSIWSKWLLTRPAVFGLTAYPVLRFKLARGQALMDSDVGNDLLDAFSQTPPRVSRMCNLQARLGLLQLNHIDAFNEGARRNAQLLTDALGEVPGVSVPRPTDGHHIYVYYPLTVAPERRDDLRHHLLRQGVDAKTTDMSDCTTLTAFRQADAAEPGCQRPTADAMLELCVYPEISPASIRRMARGIRTWAGLPAASHPDYRHDAKEKRAS